MHLGRRTTSNVQHCALLLALFMLASLIFSIPAASTQAAIPTFTCNDVIRIMPLGDSITQGYASGISNVADQISYRKTLHDNLLAQGRIFDYVGGRSAGSNYANFDADHQGTPGWTAEQLADEVYAYMVANAPNIVLLHAGTNDVDPSNVNDMEDLLDEIDRYEDDYSTQVTVIVARIISRVPGKPYVAETTQFNINLASLVNDRISNGDDLIFVNMESGAGFIYDYESNGGDIYNGDVTWGIHPVASGFNKMAAVWLNALLPLMPDCGDVQPNIPPTANAGPDVLLGDTDNNGSEAITLDGTGSNDLDGMIVAYRWYKNNVQVATGATPNVTLTVGDNAFVLQVEDDDGATHSDQVNYRLIASTAGTGGLVALYEFAEGSGTTITDTSGYMSPLNLTVQNAQNTTWRNGFLSVNQVPSGSQNYARITSGNAATKINEAIAYSGAFTVEAWIAPENMYQNGPARVMTLSPTPLLRNVTIGTGTGGSANPEVYSVRLNTDNYAIGQFAFDYSSSGAVRRYLTQLVVTFDESDGQLRLYVDGTLYASESVVGTLGSWQSSYPLVLSNETGENRPWLGDWHRMAIYDRAMPESEIDTRYASGPNNGSAYIIETSRNTLVAEGGLTDTYTIRPAKAPTSGNVTLTADPDDNCDLGNGAGVPVNFAFTNGNWTTARTVTVTATDDFLYENAHTCTIIHSVTASTSSVYTVGTPLGVIVASVTDNDNPINTPTNFATGNVTRTSLSLTWTDNNASETAYILERSVNSGNWSVLANLAANTSSYGDTGLTCGTAYQYRLRAFNSATSTYSGYANTSATTPACVNTPSAPAISGVSAETVALTLPSQPAGSFTLQIQRSVQAQQLGGAAIDNWVTIAQVSDGSTNYVDSTVVCEATYAYRLRWVDGQTMSNYSTPTTISTNPCPAPLTHSFGLYKNGQWLFYTIDGETTFDARFNFGPQEAGWQAIIGDWNGDTMDGIGVYKNGTWMLRSMGNNNTVNDVSFTFGPVESGWKALSGDWDGNGTDTVGLYKNGVFLLRNSNTTGPADVTINMGSASSIPVAGDWNGNGTDTVGIYASGNFTLANTNANPPQTSNPFVFGPTGWQPIVGDWDDNNTDTIGVYHEGLWRMRNTNAAQPVEIGFNYGDREGGWQPLGNFSSSPGILNQLFAATVPTPRVPIIPGPSIITPAPPSVGRDTGHNNSHQETEPDTTPEVSSTPVPTVSPTPTTTPEPTVSPELTASPEPTSMVENTVTPAPTSTMEPTSTPEATEASQTGDPTQTNG